MKRSYLLTSLFILPTLALPRAVAALNIDLRESEVGIPLPWLLFAAFVIALAVTLAIRWLIGRSQRGEQPEG